MSLQQCHECKKDVSSEAKLCPNCGAPVKKPTSITTKIVAGFFLLLLLFGFIGLISGPSTNTPITPQIVPDTWSADNLPSFKVTGQYGQTTFSVVVPKATTTAELNRLVMAFKDAKRTGNVQKLIPQWPNTGPALRLDVLIFNEPEWATSDRLRQFIMTSLNSKVQIAFAKQYTQHIRAHYVYSFADEEEGSIGYDDGMDRSRSYKQLFRIKL
jgi:hypothetical protein